MILRLDELDKQDRNIMDYRWIIGNYKFQASNSKQIPNSKLQYSITKTEFGIKKSGVLVFSGLDISSLRSHTNFGILNFGHCYLFGVCGLVLVIFSFI